MENNPYAPPGAVVDDITPVQASAQKPFFAVTTTKLLVMSLCTLGLYEIYWFYRQWKSLKERERLDVQPFWRAIFTLFFCYSLFGKVRLYGERVHLPQPLAAGALATGWILVSLFSGSDSLWWLSLATVLFLVPVQAHANQINEEFEPGHDRNGHFTAWNWVAVVVGGLMLALSVLDTL